MKMDKEMIDRVLDNSASSVESKATMDWFATEEGQEYLSQRITAESVLMGEREIEEWTGGNIPTERMRKRFLGQIKQHSRLWRWWQVAAVFIPFLLFGSTIVFLADKAGVFSDIQYAEIVVRVVNVCKSFYKMERMLSLIQQQLCAILRSLDYSVGK